MEEQDIRALAAAFDHQAKAVMNEPHALYQRLRDELPVARSEAHGGFWLLSRYDDVLEAARDYSTYTSTDGTAIPKQPIFPMYPIDVDPPQHGAFRRVLNPKFQGRYAATLENTIRRAAHESHDPTGDALNSGRLPCATGSGERAASRSDCRGFSR